MKKYPVSRNAERGGILAGILLLSKIFLRISTFHLRRCPFEIIGPSGTFEMAPAYMMGLSGILGNCT